jgi:gliding motility-associated-like protein
MLLRISKPLLLIAIVVLTVNICQGQNYSLNNGFVNGQTITTCTGTFYDRGITGNYSNNENYTVTFCPATPNTRMRMDIDQMALAGGDTLWVHDGPDANAPLISILDLNSTGANAIIANNNGGCLTVTFKSDNNLTSTGWLIRLRCAAPCQSIVGNITTNPPKDANGYVSVCLGEQITFTANINFPQNNTYYNQSTANSFFNWKLSLAGDTSGLNITQLTKTVTQSAGYRVVLTVTDSNGCKNSQPIQVKVRGSVRPTFNMTGASICQLDTTILQGNYALNQGLFITPPFSGDSIFLPDVGGTSTGCNSPYTDTIRIVDFGEGQILTSVNDFLGVFINMEHSYLGDLSMQLIAPNGNIVFLKKYPGGGTADLGEPVPGDNSNPIAGVGYLYGFTPNPTNGTMAGTTPSTHTYRDNSGVVRTNAPYLPAGTYQPADPFTNLIGTPLNGNWVIKICDHLSQDNGFVFNWSLNFNPNLYPNNETYQIGIASASWRPAPGIVSGTANTLTISPRNPGIENYTYVLTDSANCNYDTTVSVIVNALPTKPDLGADTNICNGQTINLSILNPQPGDAYTWSTGQMGVNQISITQPSSYSVLAQNNNGCKNRDTILVVPNAPIAINLGVDTAFCASNPNVLTPTMTGDINQYTWSNGSSLPTLPIAQTGLYWVEGRNPNGCKVRDSILIVDNPINSFFLPNDTSICFNGSYMLSLTPPLNTSITWNDGVVGNTRTINFGTNYSIVANNIGCLRIDGFKVGTKPLPIINVGRDTSICLGFEVPLKVNYPGATYRWSTGSTDSAILIKNAGIYWAESLLNTCTWRDSMTLTFKDCSCNVTIPNAFSPNADGINDQLRVAISCFPENYRFTIFNRMGQPVFNTTDYRKTWDGTQNGKPLPIATYYYILDYYNAGLQKQEKLSGSITIIR